jgi:hypothetical protein
LRKLVALTGGTGGFGLKPCLSMGGFNAFVNEKTVSIYHFNLKPTGFLSKSSP